MPQGRGEGEVLPAEEPGWFASIFQSALTLAKPDNQSGWLGSMLCFRGERDPPTPSSVSVPADEEEEDEQLVQSLSVAWEDLHAQAGPDQKEAWKNSEYSPLGAKLFELLLLVDNNLDHFEETSTRKGEDLLDALKVIKDDWCLLDSCALSLALAAPRHDATPTCPANGFRSLLTVLDVCVTKLVLRLRGLQSDRTRLLFEQINLSWYVNFVTDYGRILHTLHTLFHLIAGDVDRPGHRFHLFYAPDEAHLERDVIEAIVDLTKSRRTACFYGRRIGFMYDSRIRSLMSAIAAAMAGYGAGFHETVRGGEGEKAFTLPGAEGIKMSAASARAMAMGMWYMIDPAARAENISERFLSTDITFVKNFWGLTESAPLAQHAGLAVGPRLGVNKEVAIPITEDDIRTCFNDGPAGELLQKVLDSKDPVELAPVAALIDRTHEQGNLSEVENLQLKRALWFRLSRVPPPMDHFPSSNASSSSSSSSDPPPASPKSLQQLLGELAGMLGGEDPPADGIRQAEGLGEVRAQLLAYSADPPGVRTGLLIHFHGGGFVAQSPKSHEVYLRHWCKELRIPILSIDYSLAPEAWFPRAVDECYHAYCWAVANREKLGAGRRGRVVLAGDSAGGNLTMAVALKSLISGFRKPDAVVAIYPVLNVQMSASPSRVLSVMDALLPLGLLRQCLAAYAGPRVEEGGTNPLMSPMLASNELLSALPPVRLIACELDPFLDDAVFMARRLLNLGHDAQLHVMYKMPHGFLGLAAIVGGEQAREALAITITTLRECFEPLTSLDDEGGVGEVLLTTGDISLTVQSDWFV